jgi:UDP-hydrolysing UDP-N-acetyl-D-glucosamine 2-epimerase
MNSDRKRRICVVLVDRANYGRMKPVMEAIKNHPALEMQVVAAGTMVLERFGNAVEIVKKDGYPIGGRVYMELEGSTPATMAKSVGFGIVEFVNEFLRIEPDIVLLIGDRYEALAAAVAAGYMNLCIAHIQGGEVSGSIDESARHAISKFAQFHFPSTQRSADFLVRMGENPRTILTVGCPSSDLARVFDRSENGDFINTVGSGTFIDMGKPFLLVVFHPITTEYGGERVQMEELLRALEGIQMQTLLLWPNIDAGADHVSKAIRRFRDQHNKIAWLRTIVNLPPEEYLKLLANASCAIGNSSSFVRDSGYFGTPVVLVGNRQDGREHDLHLTRVNPLATQIEEAVRMQLKHGRYEPSTLYGDGYVAARIAKALSELEPYVQKRLHYVFDTLPEGVS